MWIERTSLFLFAVFVGLFLSPSAIVAHETQPPRQKAGRGPEATDSDAQERSDERDYRTFALRGRVVWLSDALERLYGVKTVPEAAQRTLALETPSGEIHPLVEDVRGRSFRKDERLMGRKMELTVRQYEGSPLVQVVQIFTLKKDGKYALDYWCDICSIPMYELKPCDCCQGPIRLRERKVEE